MKKAMLMIWLIVFIPICSSLSIASLSDTRASGKDNLNGFRKANDFTNVQTTANIDGKPVDSTQVVYKDSEIEKEFNCVPNSDNHTSQCTVSIEENYMTKKNHYYVILYDEIGNSVDTVDQYLYVDSMAPFGSFAIRETIIGVGKDVTIDYSVTDRAYETTSK